MHWLRSFLRRLSRLWHWLRVEYGFFRAHRPAYAPVTVPPLPPHLRADSGSLDQHLEFIKNIYEQENDRKTVLESKAAQLLGQAGVVLSLVGILIPLLADSLKQPWLLSVVTGLFSVTMLLFTNAVYHASSLTKVWRWRYMQPGAENIFTQYDPPTDPALPYEPYKSELVRDYYQSFKHNQTVNDQKANFLSQLLYVRAAAHGRAGTSSQPGSVTQARHPHRGAAKGRASRSRGEGLTLSLFICSLSRYQPDCLLAGPQKLEVVQLAETFSAMSYDALHKTPIRASKAGIYSATTLVPYPWKQHSKHVSGGREPGRVLGKAKR